MKIIIDNAIPFVKGVFEPYCSVEYYDGKSFTCDRVADADALLIRTRTKCNRELLENSKVKHIATATIGFDHIDMKYCQEAGIEVSTAQGCNARAVLQWVAAVLAQLSQIGGWTPEQKRLGVVGVGNVGRLIEEYATQWGFKVVCCDPPRKEREGGDFITFDALCAVADIITFHTPLDASTHHMLCSEALSNIKRECVILNSSRGEVVETSALISSSNPFVLDVWEQEPNISDQALEKAIFATPHIAGYSLQGKANASRIAVRNIARALNLPLTDWKSDTPEVKAKNITWQELCKTINEYFDINAQSKILKENKELFEDLRNNYDYRSEYF